MTKKPIGRPKKALKDVKIGFPVRLKPALIKRIKKEASINKMKPSTLAEKTLDYYIML